MGRGVSCRIGTGRRDGVKGLGLVALLLSVAFRANGEPIMVPAQELTALWKSADRSGSALAVEGWSWSNNRWLLLMLFRMGAGTRKIPEPGPGHYNTAGTLGKSGKMFSMKSRHNLDCNTED